MQSSNLKNHFLIAMPNLDDPHFHQSVTYICEHDAEGAMGLMLTRKTDLNFTTMLSQLGIESTNSQLDERLLLAGGPVDTQNGFILHRPMGTWENTHAVSHEVGLTTSQDVLEAIAGNEGPAEAIVALGYANWDSGQLEEEIISNAWLTCPADADIIFKTQPELLWQAAANVLGVDFSLMSGDMGHA